MSLSSFGHRCLRSTGQGGLGRHSTCSTVLKLEVAFGDQRQDSTACGSFGIHRPYDRKLESKGLL